MELKDWLNSINYTKKNLIEDDPTLTKEYSPFIINRCLSGNYDCVLLANEMNMNSHINNDMQYSFFLNTIRKRKRFSPWIRKDKIQNLECIKKYYGYSNQKALQVLHLLTEEQIEFIKQRLEIGGTNGKSNN